MIRRRIRAALCGLAVCATFLFGSLLSADLPQQLPGTRPLAMEGDIAAELVAGVDAFLLKKTESAAASRKQHWDFAFDGGEDYKRHIGPLRTRLQRILGAADPRVPFDDLELVGTTKQPPLVGEGETYKVFAVRWPVLAFPGPSWPKEVSLHAEGLLLIPNGAKNYVADVIALPDADQTPEQIAGLAEGVDAKSQFARRAAEYGCRVLVPTLISREYKARNGRAKMTHREYVYRSAFELGRHVMGYEVQEVLAAVDWFQSQQGEKARVGVLGYGEGGLIAMYAAAIDPRIQSVSVAGCFDRRENLWRQPISRNVFGLLNHFGDAEVAAMIEGKLAVDLMARGPEVKLPSEGGAPGVLAPPDQAELNREGNRAFEINPARKTSFYGLRVGLPWSADVAVRTLLRRWHDTTKLPTPKAALPEKKLSEGFDSGLRQNRLVAMMDRHNQWLLRESPYVRRERFWNKLDYSSPEAYEKSIEPFRTEFRDEVIGRFDDKVLPFNPRARKTYDEAKWTGYEVVLDVWPDVIAYGILCLPNDLKLDGSDKRPVVVCQHGLEGRPQDIVAGDHRAYHDFASKLAERGFITFSPQNLYIGRDKFRTLQRKANPLGKTLFSIIVPQHQQIVDWLKTLPCVDEKRIALYGLSYGGKTAMRVPPLVKDYCLSICSADFNDWVWKNASTRAPYSYVWTGEYEIFEWDLGGTFNYAEMAALIAPRPFMVERGHFDGVAPDERVAYEFAKVRHLYNARLKLPADNCQIEWFAGPHTINGQGTFDFLHRHLNWTKR